MTNPFLSTYPAYPSHLDRLRTTDFVLLDREGILYADHTGMFSPPPQSLIAAGSYLHANTVWGNPHSGLNPASRRTTMLIEAARDAVLRFFNAQDYVCAFELNATHSFHLLQESFPFGPSRGLVIPYDMHNSGNGALPFAIRAHAPTRHTFLTPTMRLDDADLAHALLTTPPGLFILPAQSNFSGVKHSLNYVNEAQKLGWRVCLDASAFVPTSPLDLSEYRPDYVLLSIYKMIGYPMGVGCLLIRKDALPELLGHKPSFTGGTVLFVTIKGGQHVLLPGHEAFEEGTPNAQGIAVVPLALDYLSQIGMEVVNYKVMALGGWLLQGLRQLKHSNGQRLVRFHGPDGMILRGATFSISLLDPEGQLIDERIVGVRADDANICLRYGCFCNPGSGETAFQISEQQAQAARRITDSQTMEQWMSEWGMKVGGAIRISLGLPNTPSDVEKLIRFFQSFVDQTQHPEAARLPARSGC